MAALIPLINELLPMIMPAEVHVTPAVEIEEAIQSKEQPQPDGTAAFVRQGALVNCGSSMCASVLVVKPHSSTHVHHNGEQDAIVIATSGTGLLLTLPDIEMDEPTRHVLAPGSFAFIPAWTEHRFINETNEDIRWTIVQSGSKPIVVDLDGWAGDEIKRTKNKKNKGSWIVVKP